MSIAKRDTSHIVSWTNTDIAKLIARKINEIQIQLDDIKEDIRVIKEKLN